MLLKWHIIKLNHIYIADYEDMSLSSKNALLKVAEEPPQKAYIALTANNKNEVLPTLLGRGIVIELSDYSKEELYEIARQKQVNKDVVEISNVPGDLDLAKDLDVEAFNAFIESVWNNLKVASQGNALQITSKLKIKDSDTGYDLNLFLNAVTKKAIEWISSNKTDRNLAIIDEILQLIYKTKQQFGSRYSKIAGADNFILELKRLLDGVI